MELNLNKEITNKTQEDTEITNFINELNSTLEKKQELKSNNCLYNDIIENVELAPKFRNMLQSVIDKCLEDLSYERDFFYFDYDKIAKEYCLKYYWNGSNIICDNLTQEDIERYKNKGITFYEPINDDGTIVESDTLKDWMKCEVESALLDLDIKNRKVKENKNEL